eukprot:s4601_g2.t1
MAYPVDWDFIQKTYVSMAPKDLGSMGYTGPAGTFIPNQVQSHAYSTQGKALEFYRDWNASWNQPSNFFSSLSSIDVSKLVPCNESGGVRADDVVMRRHVHFTGDIDGVVINNDARLLQQITGEPGWQFQGETCRRREAFDKGAFG